MNLARPLLYKRCNKIAHTFSKMKFLENLPMQARNKTIFLSLLFFSATFLFFSYIAFAGDITIVGEVNDTHQIVADGKIYEVAVTEKGDDLVMNYVAEKVEVTGTVEEKEDMIIITVKSFRVVPE
jgi:hypothetical protein